MTLNHMSDFHHLSAIDARAVMRCECSCLEEYVIQRDLKLCPSKLEKMFDSIVFADKHPFLTSLIDNDFHSDSNIVSLVMMLGMTIWSIIAQIVLSLVFSSASQAAVIASIVFNCAGSGCIMMAFVLNVVDGVSALRFARSLKVLQV